MMPETALAVALRGSGVIRRGCRAAGPLGWAGGSRRSGGLKLVDGSDGEGELLLSPVVLGNLHLRNRIVMAPMTRSRSSSSGVLPVSAALYYEQRSGAGLIITEGVCVSPSAVGNPGVPGIWNDQHVAMWQAVTDRVHAAGGTIVLQLWHTGRCSHPSVQPTGAPPAAPSPIAVNGAAFTAEGRVPFAVPREIRRGEIPGLVRCYADAATRAMTARFDGVEIHGANGYLPDQFLHMSSNRRTDAYGGPAENRARFMVEVVEAVCAAAGPGRTGLRLSPASTFNDMDDPDPAGLYGHLLDRLAGHSLAYLHVVEPGISGSQSAEPTDGALDSAWVRKRWPTGLITAGNYTRTTALAALRSGQADAVAFGRPFISNPDLPRRLAEDLPLQPAVRELFYGGTNAGYTDYPSWEDDEGRGRVAQ
jgi:N-ethylmaleimide reductase